MKSKIKIFFTLLLSVLLFAHCEFLDVVPDNTIEVESLFENRESALRALTAVYSYMPNFELLHNTMNLAGDEWTPRLDPGFFDNSAFLRGLRLMRGLNNSGNPVLNFWAEGNGARGLYRGIRMANIFLNYIHLTPDLSPSERADWIAQVNFLRAYYHFWLIRLYGPIVIVEENLPPSANVEDVRLARQSIDTSFDFVLGLIDQVIASNALPPTRIATELGKVDGLIARAIRAQIKLTRASPLFNGNTTYFSNFRDHNGELFFPMEYRHSLWRDAAEAAQEAIRFAHEHGRELFTFDGVIPHWDLTDVAESYILRYVYNNRFSIVEPWNNELIWGFSNVAFGAVDNFAGTTQIRINYPDSDSHARNWLGATFRMTEVFHSRNGLPIEDDITFPFEDRFELTTSPDPSDGWHRGVMRPNNTTIRLHLDREPRFYAWLIVDGGVVRLHNQRLNIGMMFNQNDLTINTPWGSRRPQSTTDFLHSGIGVQKLNHPESGQGHWARVVRFPAPIMRLADLYLMFAEAYNEYHGPGQAAFDKVNAVRARSGLRSVQDTWSDPTIASPRVLNSHLNRDGFREIIHREREIELSFEGHRFFDVLRWRKAGRYFTAPQRGWNTLGPTPALFYVLQIQQERVWQTPRDNFMPIPLMELNRNPKLVQNPGW